MPRSVTPPADGAECGFAGQMEIAPQESRRRSRLGSSTAVASLARHGICSPRLVPRRPRHMPRRSSRSLWCAVAARRLLPLAPLLASLSLRSCQPQPQTLALRSRAGSSARLRWGGGAVSVGLRMPHRSLAPRRAKAGRLQGSSNVIRGSDAPRTTPSLHRGDPFSARSSLRPGRQWGQVPTCNKLDRPGRALRESEVQNLKVFGENHDVAAFATSPSADEAFGNALRVLLGRRMDLSGPDSSSVFSAQHPGASPGNAAEVSVPLRRNRASLVSFSALSAFPVASVQTGRPPGPRECEGHERRTGRDLTQRLQRRLPSSWRT